MRDLRAKLKDRFLLDGGMGSQVIARGLEVDKCIDNLTLTSPLSIESIHKSYIEAGSDAILTNTFGANRLSLARHGLSKEVGRLNTEAAKLARRAAGEDKFVLGDIGPCGDFLEPIGTLSPEELKDVFAEQASALEKGGVDGFIIETMTSMDEVAVAVEAVKSVSHLPILASISFDKTPDGYRTMMGLDAEEAVSILTCLGVAAVGFNCGRMSLDDYVELAELYMTFISELNVDIPVFAEPNAGLPEVIGEKTVYSVGPVQFAKACMHIEKKGIKIIGGCCGTGPEHIRAMAAVVK